GPPARLLRAARRARRPRGARAHGPRAPRGVGDPHRVPRRARPICARAAREGDAQPGRARQDLRARRQARAARGVALERGAGRLGPPARADARRARRAGARSRARRRERALGRAGRSGRGDEPATDDRRAQGRGGSSEVRGPTPLDPHASPGRGCDPARVEAAVRELLLAVGEAPDREGLRAPPARVARAYAETFSGLWQDPREALSTTFDIGHDELILVKDIDVYSTCEHHLVPFHGAAHVGYIPSEGRVTGLSKLARLVDVFARRPQVQERLTA